MASVDENWHTSRDSDIATMGHIRHYRVLPWPTRPLTSLESIAKVSDQQVAKTSISSTGRTKFTTSGAQM